METFLVFIVDGSESRVGFEGNLGDQRGLVHVAKRRWGTKGVEVDERQPRYRGTP